MAGKASLTEQQLIAYYIEQTTKKLVQEVISEALKEEQNDQEEIEKEKLLAEQERQRVNEEKIQLQLEAEATAEQQKELLKQQEVERQKQLERQQLEIQQEEQRSIGPQKAMTTSTVDVTKGSDDYENVPMDLTMPVKKPDYYEDEESYSYGSSISMKEIEEDALTPEVNSYLEQKPPELEAKLDRIEKLMKVRQRRAIDPDIQRRNLEHYEIAKVSTLNKHQYCMQMIQKYHDQLSQSQKSLSQGKQEKTTQIEKEKEDRYEIVEEPLEPEYLEPIGGDTLPPPQDDQEQTKFKEPYVSPPRPSGNSKKRRMLQNKPGIEKQQEERSEIIQIVQDWVGNGKENGKLPEQKKYDYPKKELTTIKEEMSTEMLVSKEDLVWDGYDEHHKNGKSKLRSPKEEVPKETPKENTYSSLGKNGKAGSFSTEEKPRKIL